MSMVIRSVLLVALAYLAWNHYAHRPEAVPQVSVR